MKTLVVEASPRREGSSITIAGSFMRGLRYGGETQIREYVLNDICPSTGGTCGTDEELGGRT